MIVVPKDDQILDDDVEVATRFFELTLGSLYDHGQGIDTKRVLNAFLAVSAFGNIIVMTFIAARGK